MYIIDFTIAAIGIVLGLAFYMGKGASLIAGYNTISKEKKSKIDEKALCKFMGKSMFALSFGIILWGISDIIKLPIIHTIGSIIFFSTVIFMIVYLNTKNRFMK